MRIRAWGFRRMRKSFDRATLSRTRKHIAYAFAFLSFLFCLLHWLYVCVRAYIHTYMYISIYRYIMFCYITGYFFSVLVVVQKKRGLSRFLPKVSCALKTGSKENDRSEPKLLPAIVSSIIRWYLEMCVFSMNFVLRMCSSLPFLFLLPFVWP